MRRGSVPLTVIVAVRNEAANIARCLRSLAPAAKVYAVDSRSTDATAEIAAQEGAEVVQFDFRGGYPRKRQWAIDTLPLAGDWVLLIDADETVPEALWEEIAAAVQGQGVDAWFARKEFHFMGRRLRFGGFSHSAVLLFRKGRARFERLVEEDASGLDMEVHERMQVVGDTRHFRTQLVHEDFKGLDAYFERHVRYAAWQAKARRAAMAGAAGATGAGGQIEARLFGDVQERRRWLKNLAMRVPFEPLWWFLYHYVLRLGFLEGAPGLIASVIRANHVAQIRAMMLEEELR